MNANHPFSGRRLLLKTVMLSLMGLTSVAADSALAGEYVVQPGDVIDISVVGMPDLHRRSAIDLNGQLSLPLIGEVEAAGLSLPALRSHVRRAFESQAHRARNDNSSGNIILSEEVTLDIAEYRPVYITGGVLTPGAHPFRPGMTVRQAIALAGGLGRPGANEMSTQLRVAALFGQKATTALEIERQSARVSRLEAELAALNGQAYAPKPSAGPAAQTEEKLRLERASDFAVESDALKRGFQQVSVRLSQLEQQLKTEERAKQLDDVELQKLEALMAKGLVTGQRVAETRRFVLMSSTRALQTSVQAEAARREMDDLKTKLERLPTQRRIALLAEAQEARLRLGDLTATLAAITDQLSMAASTPSGKDESPVFSITRVKGAQNLTITVAQDAFLEPGDVIGIAARAEPALASIR